MILSAFLLLTSFFCVFCVLATSSPAFPSFSSPFSSPFSAFLFLVLFFSRLLVFSRPFSPTCLTLKPASIAFAWTRLKSLYYSDVILKLELLVWRAASILFAAQLAALSSAAVSVWFDIFSVALVPTSSAVLLILALGPAVAVPDTVVAQFVWSEARDRTASAMASAPVAAAPAMAL